MKVAISNASCDLDDMALIKAASFVPFGAGATLCNIIIVLALMRQKNLRRRKEYLILTGLAFADFVEGFATFIGGLYRMSAVLGGWAFEPVSTLYCMLLPHSWIWRWSDTATSFMLVVVSVDRFMSAGIPLRYFKFTKVYAYRFIGSVYAYSLVSSMFAWIYPIEEMHRRPGVAQLCGTWDFVSPRYYQYSKYITSFASVLSVLLYIPLICIMRNQLSNIAGRISYSQVDRRKRAQLRVTVTLGISSVATLLLDALPRAYGMYGMAHEIRTGLTAGNCGSAHMYLFHLSKLNSMFNVFLYYTRHREMRLAIRALFCPSKVVISGATFGSSHNRL
uniref:G-protein coupled receptors family 1 profile domain-containing protein n=1 Tax=Plectus sambesii TaxID=2011161 RepID=A0A914V6K5_9BILA